MHPLINQRVGFHEAEVTPNENGTASVMFLMKNDTIQFDDVTAHWRRIFIENENGLTDSYFLTSASVTNKI